MKQKGLTPEERAFLTEELYAEVQKIHNRPWKPFWKSFKSFKELEIWKKKQKDPRLW